MASLSEAAEGLFKKGKRKSASSIQVECARHDKQDDHKQLNQLLDILLDPRKPISDSENLDWLKWLIAGGKSPEEFAQSVKDYDNATTCGLVWTANFVAYRCRTCGISPCMSLCAECFQKGNHEGHDFNMFRSQAGGACDCGDASVMKESGFCVRHGPGAGVDKPVAPKDLLCVAEAMLPRLLHRLVVQLRKNSADALKEADAFITNILTQMTDMGAAMRTVMSNALINPSIYSSLASKCDNRELEISNLLHDRYQTYLIAKKDMATFIPSTNFHPTISAFEKDLNHSSFAEELLFWTIINEFPQKLVCFLLNMLPDSQYKEAFAEAFVHHYSRVSMMLARFRPGEDSNGHSLSRPSPHDLLSNCVVHVSVQLFSNEPLAAKLCRDQHLLHVIIASLRATIEGANGGPDDVRGILVPSRLQNAARNRHLVVTCDHYIMRKHSYWPLVSDLNNILTHLPVALLFMNDSSLLEMWLEFITNFQGMNLNTREFDEHIEFENESYYAAFSAELEICATPVWTLVSHLKNESTAHITRQVIKHTQICLEKWFELIGFESYESPTAYQATFHIPLHRYYAIFMRHAIQHQGLSLDELLPSSEAKLQLYLAHPLQVLIGFYEILCGLWVRNGLQMKGQAMTYIQCHFCNSMVDPDLFLIQQCASKLDPDWFIEAVFERFHVSDWLSFSYTKEKPYRRSFLEVDQMMPMLEGALTFLATTFSMRTNLGISEEAITRQEMVTLLAMGDRTHSQLMDLLPEKCGTTAQNKDFEKILAQVAEYRAPTLESGGNLSQGMFFPKSEVWEKEFDPLHVLLRAVHRRDYQSSMDRFTTYVKQNGKVQSSSLPWPPFRLPSEPDTSKFLDPRKLLYSKVLHGVIFTILYKALYVCDVTDQVLALTVYLLELALCYPSPEASSPVPTIEELSAPFSVDDKKYSEWFSSNWILVNFNTTIQVISSPQNANENETSMMTQSQESEGPSVEEMEVDLHSSSEEEDNEQFMSADESFDNEEQSVQMGIEAGPETQSLPTINIPLALPPPISLSDLPSPSASSALVPIQNQAIANVQTPSPVTTPMQLGPAPLPGPSTSPNTTTAVVLRNPSLSRSNARRIRRRPRLNANHRSLECYPTEAHSAPAGRLDSEMVDLMRALPSSSSATNISRSSVSVNESILSLLLKLHSKLTNEPDSCKPGPVDESRIGDGRHFIKRVVNIYAKLNVANGVESINVWRQRLWPRAPPKSPLLNSPTGSSPSSNFEEPDEGKTNRDIKEERRRKAKERQQKLMAEFASKQKAFMKKMEMMGEGEKGDVEDEPSTSSPQQSTFLKVSEYECVICGQTCSSSQDRLMGMVALLQSTSVLAHSQPHNKPHADLIDPNEKTRNMLPCDDDEVRLHQKRTTLANYMEAKIDEFSHNFNNSSWLNSLSIGWEGGVHVQTCGHYLHLDCHKSYMQSLRSGQGSRHGLEQGEYACPLCRQMANSVLPINPGIGQLGAVVQCRPNDLQSVSEELVCLLTNSHLDRDGGLIKLLGNFMEDLTRATLPQFRSVRTNPTTQSLFLFLCSIVRTNLETEVLVKLSRSTPTGAKKVCFVSLFHVLALNAKVFILQPYTPLWHQLTGLALVEQSAVTIAHPEKDVPLLLKDASALLIQFFFALPLNVDKAFFTCVVQMLFNLNVVQAVAQLTCLITDDERLKMKESFLGSQGDNNGFLSSLPTFMGMIIDVFEQSPLYMNLDDEDMVSANKVWSLKDLAEAAKSICLPFMRTSAVLQSHLYGDTFPEDIDEKRENEFPVLRTFLGLHEADREDPVLSSLFWPSDSPMAIIKTWCHEYTALVQKSLITARKLLRNKPVSLERPCLLKLPHTYDQLFLYYHTRKCKNCDKVPKEPCVCLVCGSLVCMREQCCRSHTSQTLEAVHHSEVCGAGTAIYLAVNSSTIIVIRGKRACVWGSVYLDTFGEEDRDLKRGKPLYLSQQRYWVLEQQWLTHSFDHTNKRWVWHKDTL